MTTNEFELIRNPMLVKLRQTICRLISFKPGQMHLELGLSHNSVTIKKQEQTIVVFNYATRGLVCAGGNQQPNATLLNRHARVGFRNVYVEFKDVCAK